MPSGKSKSIAIAGSGGRLGAAVARHFESAGFPVVRFDRQSLDLSQPSALAAALDRASFDVLVNCAALTNVDYCEQHPGEAFKINAEAPAAIAENCASRGARLVHVGTDYVYEGSEPGPRTEGDPTEPQSHYGRSKLEGDLAVLAVDPSHLVVRTSWVFGTDRPSFLDAMLGRALQGGPVAAIGDKFSSPCYSEDFADLLGPLLDLPVPGGVINLCNSGTCSWQEYAQAGVDSALAQGIPLATRHVDATPLADMHQFVAQRPVHTAMATAYYTSLTGRQPRPWRDAVQAYIETSWAPRHRP